MKQRNIDVPKWHKDLDIFNNIKSTFIIEGNVHDLQPFVNVDKQICDFYSLNDCLYRYLKKKGYDIVVFYNKTEGFHNHFSQNSIEKINSIISRKISNNCDLLEVSRILKELLENKEYFVCIIFDIANTLINSVEMLNENEMHFYTSLLLLSKKRKQSLNSTGNLLTNHIFLICDKSNDIPAWIYNNNPYVEIMHISQSNNEYRKNFIVSSLKKLDSSIDEIMLDEKASYLSYLSSGMSNLDLHGLFVIAKQNKCSIDDIPFIINKMKYGESNSPWLKIDQKRIVNADKILKQRVKGQDHIIDKVKDILMRATLNISTNSRSNKPKGIMFFAGPTGTGKTELAKSIAELLFYDETNIIRFDMSEYGESHSDQKLFGAPPGYIGYETGGQLTNAVKNNPFSILLFDEIDKANSAIMDKFLQILDDGRMTDGQGNTVYFSESLIIFTSNIGMQRKIEDYLGNTEFKNLIDYSNSYSEMSEIITKELKSVMKPEIINRIGDNILIFDFIRDENVDLILKQLLENVIQDVKKKLTITITYSDEYYHYLRDESLLNIEYGGRGIKNVVESHFVNYVSKVIFSNEEISNVYIDYDNEIIFKINT